MNNEQKTLQKMIKYNEERKSRFSKLDEENNKYEFYFKSLDNFIIKEELKIDFKEDVDCCYNQSLIKDYTNGSVICENCGICYTDNIEYIDVPIYKNPKFHLSTKMSYLPKWRSIHRLHNWSNYDYQENTANKSYKDIEELGIKLGLHNKQIQKATQYYKIIYIDNNTSSRNKIKKCLFLYCLYKASNYKLNIIQILNDNNLTINNFNKAMTKINDEDKLFLHNKMINYQKIFLNYYRKKSIKYLTNKYNDFCKLHNLKYDINNTIQNYNLFIQNYKEEEEEENTIDIILRYNIFTKKVKENNIKINNNTILLACFFWYIKCDKDYMFETLFKTTTNTIELKIKTLFNL